MADGKVSIRGTSDGLIVYFNQGDLDTILNELQERFESKASFFLGGRVALCIGDRRLTGGDLLAIGSIIETAGMTLWAVDGGHPDTMIAVRELGLETSLRPGQPHAASALKTPPAREEMPGIVVRRTLRSGQAVHHWGHITIIGDVYPGAELVAGGDIVVWGRLMGTAHAGAIGDEGAVICALQLAPRQIRIANRVARSPERSSPPAVPEMASVQDDWIVVEVWRRK